MADHEKIKALGWNPCDSTMTHQLTATTYMTDKIYPAPINAFPDNIQSIQGLSEIYLSGYIKPIEAYPSLSATGEIISIREEGNVIKTYNFVFAVTDDHQVYWAGPWKDFDLHHTDIGAPVPLDEIFGNTPYSKS